MGLICNLNIFIEKDGFPKGILDLYRVIAPIVASKFTVSPRKSPQKIFLQKIFLDAANSGGLFERGGMICSNQKYYQYYSFLLLDAAQYAQTADILR